MKIEITDEGKEFLGKALFQVALSLEGKATDNSKLSDLDKLRILSCCYNLQLALNYAEPDDENKGDKMSELDSDNGHGIHLSPEQQKEMKKQYDELMSKQVLRMEPPKLDLHFPWDNK
ncbi:MAG: hypothetical protein LKJ17_10700 [Oscillospiraceae bacterium]|jgi:predicted transglutaminase-like protease|nr:hypothetical protein [Oscillospiraceae bacterium]